MRIVHSRPDEMGKFILIEGVKGGREELAVRPPLFIYGQGNVYSSGMMDIFHDLSSFPAFSDGQSSAQ
jgi:tRNA1(Val) A37 N6-methylase TrmN6